MANKTLSTEEILNLIFQEKTIEEEQVKKEIEQELAILYLSATHTNIDQIEKHIQEQVEKHDLNYNNIMYMAEDFSKI